MASLGRTGQGIFAVFVVEQVVEGSIFNVANNFQITTKILTCNLDVQTQITAERVSLATGPIEALMEKHFGI